MLEHSRPALLDELTAPRNALKPDSKGRIVWGNGTVTLVFAVSDDRPVTLIGMSGRGMEPVDANIAGEPDAQPIVELRSSLDGGGDNRLKLAVSSAGLKLRFVRAYELNRLGDERQPVTLLAIVQRDGRGRPVGDERVRGHGAHERRAHLHTVVQRGAISSGGGVVDERNTAHGSGQTGGCAGAGLLGRKLVGLRERLAKRPAAFHHAARPQPGDQSGHVLRPIRPPFHLDVVPANSSRWASSKEAAARVSSAISHSHGRSSTTAPGNGRSARTTRVCA